MKSEKQTQILNIINEHQQSALALLEDSEGILLPAKSYSAGDEYRCIHVLYVSDIHLDYHLWNEGIDLSDNEAVAEYFDRIVEQMLDLNEIRELFNYPPNKDFLWSELAEQCGEKEADALFLQIRSEKDLDQSTLPRFLHHCVIFNGDISGSINLTSLFFERLMLCLNQTTHCRMFITLGNHEFHEFENEDEAIKAYKNALSQYGVTVLNNELVEYENCFVLGGTGFAKYNDNYNAETLICSKRMQGNRRIEAEETDKFVAVYKEALKQANASHKPVIVFTHYPVRDWLNDSLSDQCYYFSGHNHNNEVFITDRFQIYSDNQIGYKNNIIGFKEAILGTCYNPFINYNDGVYEITPDQYRAFYLYNGESIGIGIIQKKIQAGSTLFMIKRNGFYGFFIQDEHGMKICRGGRVKNINSITDIEYFDKSFNYVVATFVKAILPYYKVEQILSEEIKQLHIPSYNSGRIHGCIIDVDFFHHIMINPFDGKITFYYSPVWGIVEPFSSIEQLLVSVEKKNDLLAQSREYSESKNAVLSNKGLLISKTDSELTDLVGKTVVIDIKNSLYSVSQKMKQYQRLFTANILREWNDSIIENLIQVDDINIEYGAKKEPSLYVKVQKNWQYLMNIDSSEITSAMVKSVVNCNRKLHFPYQRIEKDGKYSHCYDPLPDVKIREYIDHIPNLFLVEYFQDFLEILGIDIIRFYPLELLTAEDYDLIPDYCGFDNKELIEIASQIPEKEWTTAFGNFLADTITLKNRPRYCSTELWNHINKYRDN